MGHSRTWRALCAVAALSTAGTAVLLGAGPAFAADQLHIDIVESGLTLPKAVGGVAVAKTLHLYVAHDQGGHIPSATLTVDTAGLKGVAVVTWPSNCTHSGAIGTCKIDHVYDLDSQAVPVYLGIGLKADPKAVNGAKGSLSLKATAPGLSSYEEPVDISVNTGADMTIAPLPELHNVALGTTLSEPVVWSNTGNATAPSSILTFDTMAGLELKQHFSNCKYGKPFGAASVVEAVCTINQPLAPGHALRLSQNLQVGVTKEAYYSVMSVSVLPPGGVVRTAAGGGYVQGTGPELTAVDAPVPTRTRNAVGDINPNDSYTELDVYAKNTADFAAVGASVKGDKGRTVPVSVGARNNGPGLIYDRSGGEGTGGFKVTFPAGATVTKIPSGCFLDNRTGVAGHGPYVCGSDYLQAPGYQKLVTFSVRLDQQLKNVRGTVALDNELADFQGKPATFPWDKNQADNTAPIVFNGPALPSSAPSTTGSASAAPSTGATGGSGLAETGGGSSSLPIALGAAAAVALGAGGVLVARRRRASAHG